MAEKLLKNRYLIEDVDRDKLGAGSFGITYLAKDTRYKSLVKKVVVKHLQPPPESFDIALKFFQREADVLGKLGSEHGQIPTLVDYFNEDNDFYIVQEWIDGETLSSAFNGKPWTQKDTIDLLIEILEPLKFCHDEGTIHRDLKPANLMRRRSDGKLVIIDFGAVREIGQLTLLPNGQERPGSIIWSKGYGAPEQCNGNPELASDVYAVGAIGIQAMTGLPPAMIATPFEEIPRWWEVPDRTNATQEFTEILNRMLAFSPKARYYDASAALEALRAITAKYPQAGEIPAKTINASPTTQVSISQSVITQPSTVLPAKVINTPPTTQPSISQSVITQPRTVIPAPSSLTETPQISKLASQTGEPSQEIFSFEINRLEIFAFETAKLEQVVVEKVEIIKKPGWLGFGQKEERVTKKVQEWRVKKSQGKAERFIEDLGNAVQLEMVYVPRGSFTMGSEEYDSEKPRHVVMVPSFYMGRFQVTQEQYLQIMGRNPSNWQWQDAKLPVEGVFWNDAQVFCEKLSAKTGKKYRLPSEAEWEYACRAKTDTPFYFGETISTDLANYNGNYTYKSGVKGLYRSKTTPVGSFPANSFGLHDMHGNVWEWCADKRHENYHGAPTDGSAWVDYQTDWLLRGGSWDYSPHYCRSADRGNWSADIMPNNIGFRLVCAPDL